MNTTDTPPKEVEVLPSLEMSECPQEFQVKIRASFGEFLAQADTLVSKAREITEMNESPEQEKAARETRLALVKVRTGAEKLHKDIKADILVQGRAIDGAKNIVIAATEPTEKELKAIEDRAELRAEEARRKLHDERHAELNQYTTAYNTLSLGRMTDEEYAGLLDDAKLAHEARIAREKKAEEERIAAEKAAEEERKRKEQERIAAEKKAAEERAELQRKLAAEKAQRERIEAVAKAERDRLEAEEAKRRHARAIISHIQEVGRGTIGGKPQPYAILLRELETKIIIDDKMGELQDEVRTILESTRANVIAAMEGDAVRAKLEAEMKAHYNKLKEAKAEADRLAKIEADRIAAEKAAKEAAEAEAAKAALAPDKEKIAAYALALKAIEMPIGSTTAGKKACAEIGVIVDRALAEIRTIYTALK